MLVFGLRSAIIEDNFKIDFRISWNLGQHVYILLWYVPTWQAERQAAGWKARCSLQQSWQEYAADYVAKSARTSSSTI